MCSSLRKPEITDSSSSPANSPSASCRSNLPPRQIAPTGLFVDEKNGDRGMVVFVDAQLRMSKRFDAAGLAEGSSQSIQAGIPKAKLVLGFRECPSTYPSERNFGDLPRRLQKDGPVPVDIALSLVEMGRYSLHLGSC